MIGGANACEPDRVHLRLFCDLACGIDPEASGMDELSSVLGEVLRVLGVEGPQESCPAEELPEA